MSIIKNLVRGLKIAHQVQCAVIKPFSSIVIIEDMLKLSCVQQTIMDKVIAGEVGVEALITSKEIQERSNEIMNKAYTFGQKVGAALRK